MNERIKWIDSAKGFGFFCVALEHQSPNFYVEIHLFISYVLIFLLSVFV